MLDLGVTLVTPTRRLAHHLRARHDAACVAQGLKAWRTPDVIPWGEWLHRQFQADRAAGRTAHRWLPVSLARLVWERMVSRDDRLGAVLAPAGLSAAAYRSWSLLHQYCIPDDALKADTSPEVEAFRGWVAWYRQWLRQGLWLDPALAAASVGPFPVDTPLSFVGFDHWTPEQVGLIDRLKAQGVPVAADMKTGGDDAATVQAAVFECNDFDAELESAVRWAAQGLEQDPGARYALVVSDLDRERARVRRVLDRLLAPATSLTGGPAPESQAYELAAARPLLERPVIAAALAWLDCSAGDADLAATSALLRGPHDAAAAIEAHGRAEIDVELRRAGLSRPSLLRIAHDARRHACPVTAEILQAVALRARNWSGAQLPSHWAVEFAAMLRDVGWPGPEPSSAEYQAVQRWQILLGEFGAGDDVTGPLRVRAALGHLRDLCEATAFEPQEIAAPLLVIDPDTAAGMQFDALWVCGLDATRWPAAAAPDPFLPRDVQARHGLPGANASLAELAARRTLVRLSGSAPVSICSVPRYDGETPLLPSALVADLPRLEHLEQWRGHDMSRAVFDARPGLVTLIDGALPAFALHEVARGGTRLLELQAACPFRAAVELRLGGRMLEDRVVGIAPTERGQLAHRLLEAFWRETGDHASLVALSPDALVARVHRLATQVLEPLRGVADDVRLQLLDLEQRWLEDRVLELLQTDRAREPFTVVGVETERVLDVGGVQIRVVLDRIDRLADGSYAFIDYKTGASAQPRAWMGERPELPQLPLYVRTVAQDEVSAVAFAVVRKGATGYTGFAREAGLFSALRTFDATKKPFKEFVDWPSLISTWQRRLDTLGEEHARGDARLAPDPPRACRYCHLPGLCRSAQALLDVAGDDDDEDA